MAIIAGILIAFAIDAWWDGRQAKQHEEESLRVLAEEIADSQTKLEMDRASRQMYAEVVDRLLAYISEEGVDLSPDTVSSLPAEERKPGSSD